MDPKYQCHGLSELLFAAMILIAIVYSSRVQSSASSVPRVLISRSTAQADQTDHPLSAMLHLLSTQFSAEAAWHYCWMHAATFLDTQPLPQAHVPSTIMTGFKPIISSGQLITWRFDMMAVADDTPPTHQSFPLGIGGDTLVIHITGPSLLTPKVYDLHNGTYITVFTLVDSGNYRADVSLRWRSCAAYVFCNVTNTHQPIDFIRKDLEFSVVAASSGNNNVIKTGQGRWVDVMLGATLTNTQLDSDNDKYVWVPYNTNTAIHEMLPNTKIETYFRHKYVLFIGDSLSEHAFHQMLDTFFTGSNGAQQKKVSFLVNRYTGKRMKQAWKRDGMSVVYYPPPLDLIFAFVFYPDMFPVGGSKYTRFPLVNESVNAVEPIANVTFRVDEWNVYLQQAMMDEGIRVDGKSIATPQVPDVVVFNFGLHFAAPLDPPLYSVLLRHMLMRLAAEFGSGSGNGSDIDSENGKQTQKTKEKKQNNKRVELVWRSTGWTHFEKKELAEKWNCRTPVRTEIMNEIADKLVSAAGIRYSVDFQSLTSARHDAAPDNRHFSLGNVRQTYNIMLMNTLFDIFSSSEQ